jgi:Secretion system C-terminal sorting domain/Kelch motif
MGKKILVYLVLSLLYLSKSYTQETWTPTSTVNAPTARWGHTAMWTGSKMLIWGGDLSNNSGGIFDPVTNSWQTMSSANSPSPRCYHTAIWTGSKMIIWGGSNWQPYKTGAIYDPITDSWSMLDSFNAPSPRYWHTAVWTGTKMIIWGGYNDSISLNTGGIYDPLTNNWTPVSTINCPLPIFAPHSVWTGSKMIVWGCDDNGNFLNYGGLFDPVTNSWQPMSETNAPYPRTFPTVVWTGSKMMVWGGEYGVIIYNSGGMYDPITNSWTQLSTINAPEPRYLQSAVWTGTKMIVWGGLKNIDPFVEYNSGGIYDPLSNNWAATTLAGAPLRREEHTAIWTGNKMIIWGGATEIYGFPLNTGGIYYNSILVGSENISQTIPANFSLYQNYPNPFNPSTQIKFDIPASMKGQTSNVKLVIYDLLGREVAILVNQQLRPGTYEVEWNATNYPSGVYYYKLTSREFTETKKMILIK